MRQEDVLELGALQQAGGLGQDLGVDLVPAGIEDHALVAIDDQVLVGLDRQTSAEVLEEDVLVGWARIQDGVLGHFSPLVSWGS